MEHIIVIIVVPVISLLLGLLIYWVNTRLPQKVNGAEKIEKISSALPGTDCGACGYKDCLAYAQVLAENPEIINRKPCPTALESPETIKHLEEALGIKLDTTAKKAIIYCGGNSEVILIYHGAKTCRAAARISGGHKMCPYACLGFGDCIPVCPQKAISIEDNNNIAVIDYGKCNGCGLCVDECPQNLIELDPATVRSNFLCSYSQTEDIAGRERCQYARQLISAGINHDGKQN